MKQLQKAYMLYKYKNNGELKLEWCCGIEITMKLFQHCCLSTVGP